MSERLDLVEHLAILKLEPGDVLVLTYPEMLRPAQVEALRAQMLEAVPGFQVVVLTGGVELGAVRQASDD